MLGLVSMSVIMVMVVSMIVASGGMSMSVRVIMGMRVIMRMASVRVIVAALGVEEVNRKSDEGHAESVRDHGRISRNVLKGSGEKLLKRNEDHDTSDGGKEHLNGVVIHVRREEHGEDKRSQGLANTAHHAELEGLPLGASRVIDGRGYGHALRNIVRSDGQCNGKSNIHALQASQVDGDTFREVVDRNTQSSNETNTFQFAIFL